MESQSPRARLGSAERCPCPARPELLLAAADLTCPRGSTRAPLRSLRRLRPAPQDGGASGRDHSWIEVEGPGLYARPPSYRPCTPCPARRRLTPAAGSPASSRSVRSPAPQPARRGSALPAMVLAAALGAGAARLLFYPTLLYTAARAQVPGSRRPWFHRIDGAVLLGALPLRGRSRRLVAEENVRAVVTLNEEYETRFLCCSAQEWEAMGVEQLRLSTVDLTGVPTLENLHKGVEFILKHRACGHSVYVHCKAGRSRSATMVAAYLIQLHHWSPQEAIEAIAKIRPHILIRHKQVQVLEAFHRNVITGTTS